MYALFALLFFVPLFAFDCGYSSSKDVTVFSAQQANVSSTVNVMPAGYGDLRQVNSVNAELTYNNPLPPSSNPLSLPTLSIEISNLNTSTPSSNMCNYAHLFPEITALYLNGYAQELVREANSISVFSYIGNPTLKMKKDYINSLIKGENKQHLEYLARLAGIDTPRRMRIALDAYFQKTKDPLRRCNAVVLADKATGGGNFIPNAHLPKKQHFPADGNPGLFVNRDFLAEIRQDFPQAQDVVDVEMSKYAVERYLPALGSRLTPEITQEYLKELFNIVEKIPYQYQRPLILAGIHGFYSRFADPKATVVSYKDAVWETSQSLINSIIKSSTSNISCVPQNIVDLHDDVHWLINDHSKDERLAYKVGERVGDAAFLISCYAGLRRVLTGVNCVRAVFTSSGISQAFSIIAPNVAKGGEAAISSSVQEICPEQLSRVMIQALSQQNSCVKTDQKDGTENYVFLLEKGQKASEIFNKIEELGPVHEIHVKDKGVILRRAINHKRNVVCRDHSKSFKDSKDPISTMEFQLGNKSLRLRCTDSLEAFEKMIKEGNLYDEI